MNFYVYPECDIKRAFEELRCSLDENNVVYDFKDKFCEAVDINYNFYSLTVGDFSLLYPSASLWNRKIYELLFKNLFPDVSPIQADYFLVPATICYGTPFNQRSEQIEFNKYIVHFCESLNYWQYHKNKHVFFVSGDCCDEISVLKDGKVFRTSCSRESDDYANYYDVVIDVPDLTPIYECEYDCSFIGCLETHPLRRQLPFAVDGIRGKKIFESTPNFFMEFPEESRRVMEYRWASVLNNSKFILSPRGCGLNSIRFFEALAFGRIPILIGDDTKLPLDGIIEYDKFVVRVPEKEIRKTHVFVESFLSKCDLEEASNLAKDTWANYFSGGSLNKFLQLSLPVNKMSKDINYKIM